MSQKPWLWSEKKILSKLKVKWKRGSSCQRVKFIVRERVLAHKKFVKIFIFHSPFCTLAHSSVEPHTVNLLLAAATAAKYISLINNIRQLFTHILRKPEIANSCSLFIYFFSSENEYLRATLLHDDNDEDEIPLLDSFLGNKCFYTRARVCLRKKRRFKNLLKNSPLCSL